MSRPEWIRTSKRRPCPICGRPGWCGVSADGSFVRCMRTPSDRPSPSKSGELGWIHQVGDSPLPNTHVRRHVERRPAPAIDFDRMLTDYRAKTAPAEVRRHAAQLGVTADSLYRLNIVWAGPHRAWGFPMRESDGRIVGIRLRNEAGCKWAIPGSRQGLFIPEGEVTPGDPILLCEGPTDAAALLDLGFYAIGRPSCTGCSEMLAQMLAGCHVVIVGDRDEPKSRPDGSVFYPGQEGAERLADILVTANAATVKIIYPPNAKDAREWKRKGASSDTVRMVIRQHNPWRVKR